MTPADAQFLFSALATIGAALGAVGITIGEMMYSHALVDGKLEECEKKYIRMTFWSLRWGLSLVLFGNIALIFAEYFADQQTHALTAGFWFSLFLALMIIGTGWALARGSIGWKVGSALALTSWWGIFILSVWRDLPYTLTMLYLAYALAFVVAYGAFSVRHAFSKEQHPSS